MLLMFAADYEYEQTTVIVSANAIEFKTTGSVPMKKGWKAVEASHDDKEEQTLPPYIEGNIIPFTIQTEEKETKPPQQITEAQLVKENGVMEKLGLGTEATRSSIIETLKGREYIKNDGKTKKKKEGLKSKKGNTFSAYLKYYRTGILLDLIFMID